ncbi:MAG: TRAP transporter large permease [Alphaproteobacteria bacterium]|nr:TRAP transporter large permease [Alphaproteobacteria bacterium]
MESLTIGYTCVGILLILLFAGVPVAAAMGLLGIAGMILAVSEGFAFGQLRTLPYQVTSNYGYAVLPLFVLMGTIAGASGMTERLFFATEAWMRRIRGGLYQAVVVGSALFAAINGSTTVSAVLFMRLAYPEMLKYGYPRSLSIGAIAATGSFAAMIPPSITMVLYAIICEVSVGQLLIAGILPGILTAAVYLIGIGVIVRLRPDMAPPIREAASPAVKLKAIAETWPIILLIMTISVGIYTGLFAPSAAGAVGAVGCFVLALWIFHGRFKAWLPQAMGDAASVSCIIFGILIGGLLYSRMIVVTGVIDDFVGIVGAIASTKLAFLVLVCIFYLIVGCFLDTTSMMIVTLPFIFPAAMQYDIDPIWFGILIVKLVEIAVITPPVGLNLFAVMSVVDKQTTWSHLVRGVTPFIFLEMIVLLTLVAFPEISTWLPRTMLG